MIGERLKELRTARNLSLRDLAAQAGVSATLLSQVERSVTDPSLETVRRLAAVFGESITSLFAEPNAPAVWISRPGNRSKLTAPAGRVSYERLTAARATWKCCGPSWRPARCPPTSLAGIRPPSVST